MRKNVRLVSVDTAGDGYKKDNGLLCVIKVSVEAERPANFASLPLRERAKFAHCKGQNVAKYFFVREFADEIKYIIDNATDTDITTAEREQLTKWYAFLAKVESEESASEIEKAGKVITAYLNTFSLENGMLPIWLTTASVKEVLTDTQYNGTSSIVVESNGNDVTLNEVTDFNFVESDADAELRYLRNSLVQQISNGDATPTGTAKETGTAEQKTNSDDDLGI